MRHLQTLLAAAALFVTACTGSNADDPDTGSADEGPDDRLTVAQADECTAKAWTCALDEVAALGKPTKADGKFSLGECLKSLKTASGASCATACENASPKQESPQADHCAQIVTDIVALAGADQSGLDRPCRDALIECLEDCIEEGADPTEGDPMRPFAQCWTFGLTSTCPIFARDLDSCGGDLGDNSNDACLAHCEATHGAWSSDLDELCENECPE